MLRRKNRAFTLIELLFVLLLAVSIMLFGMAQYKRYLLAKNIQVIKSNVALVFDAMNKYYLANIPYKDPTDPINPATACFSDSLMQKSNLSTLTPTLWPKLNLANQLAPNDSDYSIAAKQIVQTIGSNVCNYNFFVTVTLHDVDKNMLDWLKNALDANFYSETESSITWQAIPTAARRFDLDSSYWISKSQLQMFKNLEEGRYPTK